MRRSTLILAAAGLSLFAACGGAAPATPTPTATPDPAAALACAPETSPGGDVPGWPAPGRAQATGNAIPIIATSQLVVGPARFLFSLVDSANTVLAGPDVPVTTAFYDLAGDPGTPVSTSEAAYLDPGIARGLYRSNVEFTCAGEWGVIVTAGLPGGAVSTRVRFDVRSSGTIPAIGAEAPRSDSLVAGTPDELAGVSTDDDPDPDFYRSTVAQAVTSGKPSAILFATPLFCESATCGPMLDQVKAIAADYKGRVTFVNVEPYLLKQTDQGLQPELDAGGGLQVVSAVRDWGLLSEPYLFIVDAAGRVAASFEGLLGEDEVRAALEAVVAG